RRRIELLFAISSPARWLAARGRNLPLAVAGRKRAHVYFTQPRFVRGIAHPPAVRRELPLKLIEVRLEKEDRLPVCRGAVAQRKHPQVKIGPWISAGVYDEASVARPLLGSGSGGGEEQR